MAAPLIGDKVSTEILSGSATNFVALPACRAKVLLDFSPTFAHGVGLALEQCGLATPSDTFTSFRVRLAGSLFEELSGERTGASFRVTEVDTGDVVTWCLTIGEA